MSPQLLEQKQCWYCKKYSLELKKDKSGHEYYQCTGCGATTTITELESNE